MDSNEVVAEEWGVRRDVKRGHDAGKQARKKAMHDTPDAQCVRHSFFAHISSNSSNSRVVLRCKLLIVAGTKTC
jgi:hypothetical protein